MKQEEIEKEEINNEEVKTEDVCNNNVDNTEKNNADTVEGNQEQDNEDPLEAANKQIEELKDKYLRTMAEFDNYRKRTIKEKTELILNGGEKTVIAILPVLDDMERALANMEKAEDVAAVVEGVKLIHKKFIDILGKQGVKAIDTKDATFDVDLHEAIAQLPAPTDEMKGKVMDCTLTGYKLNDKVIRHAQVVVGL